MTPPTRTFEGRTTVTVGAKTVELIEVGPAHTRGDVLVHVPAERVVYTGDILFIHGHPIIWAGPVGNWIRACEIIMEMDAAAVVPGHGPVTDRAGVAGVKAYLEYITAEARARFDAGMDANEAARDIALDDYSSWGDAERIVVNVHTLYREFRGETATADIAALLPEMAKLARERGLQGLGTAA
jgi:glyoxylase-like metal-dependent hydrolase (beta-lactamase superfamily II)